MAWGTEPCSWAGSVGFEVGHWGGFFVFCFLMLNTRIIRHCNDIEVQTSVALSMFTLCSPHQHVSRSPQSRPAPRTPSLPPLPTLSPTSLTCLSLKLLGFRHKGAPRG